MTNEEIAAEFSAINTRLNEIDKTLKKIEKSLNGNGRPGLIERVNSLEVSTKTEDNTVAKVLERGAIIVSVVLSVFNLFFKHSN